MTSKPRNAVSFRAHGVRALVFDFDGLILDTEVSEYVTIREVFEAHGRALPLTAWSKIVGRADHPHWLDWLEDELGELLADREAVQVGRVARHHAMISQEVVRPGVVALLDAADTHGIGLAVASSSTSEWVEGHLDRLGILGRFQTVRTRDHVDRAKPWPDLYLAACRDLEVEPAQALAFEDSANGCTAAKAAGLRCVVVPNDITRDSDFSHADLVLASLADLDLEALRVGPNPGAV